MTVRNLLGIGLLLTSPILPVRGSEPTREQTDFFERKIRPVLVEQCYSCHAREAKKLKGGLRLDTREATLKGGDTGPALVPGKPEMSLLLKALKYDGLQMPPRGKLPEAVVRDFETWIRDGAVDPRSEKPLATTVDPLGVRTLWSFQEPRRQASPPIQSTDQVARPVDAFLQASLERAGVPTAPPADKPTWLRRVTLDLTGLPPTPEVLEAFVQDTRPDARERLVERLLASPAYGERWGRVWLDVSRYAEDQAHIVGNDVSLTYPNAALYRDWVIQAFNDDLPYDRFVRLQLAADLVEGNDSKNVVALGFLGLGPKYYQRNSLAVMADEWEDRVDVVARGLLGLTVACARCHDHKFDPITTEDYYGLAGIFASTRMHNRPLHEKAEKGNEGQAKLPKEAMHIVREGTPTDLTVFVRGDVNNKGRVVPRRFLSGLPAVSSPPIKEGSGRKQLAEAITSPRNPLTARVLVNRIWGHLFGRGLVATPSNFGTLGERPSHPELLDDLAVRFMEAGWSLKWLHRELVLSSAYGRASTGVDVTQDPDNRFLGRMPRRRLSVEAWRDSVLASAGQLERRIGGPSLDPQDPKQTRRTVYSMVSRLDLNRMLALFDFPDPNVTAERRVETTTPLQKMFVLNSSFMTAQATAVATRLSREHPENTRARIDRAYRLLYGRPASETEVHVGQSFLARGEIADRWTQYVHALLATNEMLYID